MTFMQFLMTCKARVVRMTIRAALPVWLGQLTILLVTVGVAATGTYFWIAQAGVFLVGLLVGLASSVLRIRNVWLEYKQRPLL